jgi:hypothetical protein
MKLPAGQSVSVSVAFTNANGRPADVQGQVTWESSDEQVAKVQAQPDDPTRATITAGPSAGTAVVVASGDADLGEGVTEVDAEIEVQVVAKGEAVGGEITPDRPDQGLPGGQPNRPDQGLPGQGRPDNTVPGQEGPDNALPGGRPDRPDQGLPNSPNRPDQGLPNSPNRPDQGLPPGAQPKR